MADAGRGRRPRDPGNASSRRRARRGALRRRGRAEADDEYYLRCVGRPVERQLPQGARNGTRTVVPGYGARTRRRSIHVEVRIQVWERSDVVKAPTSSLFRHGDGWAVFVHRRQTRTAETGRGRAENRPRSADHRRIAIRRSCRRLSELDDRRRRPSDSARLFVSERRPAHSAAGPDRVIISRSAAVWRAYSRK